MAVSQPSRPDAPAVALGEREPVLDGIRGIAILLVLIHHLVLWSGPRGDFWLDSLLRRLAGPLWIGVDLFFVLSGFLITGILYEARGSPYYFRSFYGRRVLRIFPLYYGFLALLLCVLPAWLPVESTLSAKEIQGWYWLYLGNVYTALAGWSEQSYLDHFWSLAVEEQFYLLWPFAVWSLSRTNLLRLAATCFFLALLLRVTTPFGMSETAAYVLLPTRMDALAAGAFLALLIRGNNGSATLGHWPAIAFIVSITLLGAVYLVGTSRLLITIGLTFIAVLFASSIAVVLNSAGDGPLRRIASASPLALLGKYSYGIYVLHMPIILFLQDAGLSAATFPTVWGSSVPGMLIFCAIGGLLSVALAFVSFHIWETPFLRLKRYFPYRTERNAVPTATSQYESPGRR